VFDALCKVGSLPSLNDFLERGPNLLEVIPSIFLKFRQKNIGVIADIRKAFHMIGVADQDKNFHKFLWWEEGEDGAAKLLEYRHTRVVFGLNFSHFVLAAVINHHLDGAFNSEKEVKEKLRNSLYVDNCVVSLETMQQYKQFKDVSVALLSDAKMDLRKWETNCEESEEKLT